MNIIFTSLRNLLVMTLILGVLYPLAITGLGKLFFPIRSAGSLLKSGEQVIGSELIAQKFEDPRYFFPRPSSIDYQAQGSGASQKSATSSELKKNYEERLEKWGKDAPADLLWASGSGLDPHISVAAAQFQAPRIAAARKIRVEDITKLIQFSVEERFLGFMGQPRVNVLRLNQLLNKTYQR